MPNSILDDIKEALDLVPEYQVFDKTIIMYINGVLSDLEMLGAGPAGGFVITDNQATWDEFLGNDPLFSNIKTYVTLRVKVLFDPPQTSYHMSAIDAQIQKHEWLINARYESAKQLAVTNLEVI